MRQSARWSMSPASRRTRRSSVRIWPNEVMLDDADEQKLAPMTAFRRRGPAQPTKEPTALRPWAILGAMALGRIAFGYQFQTVATLGSDLVPLFPLSYAEFGALIGAYMLLGAFVALPLGVLGRWFGDRTVTGI